MSIGPLPGGLLPAGPAGPPSWGVPHPWLAGTQYYQGPPASAVTQGGNTYVALVDHISGTVFDPAKWVLVAAKGTDGLSGLNYRGPWNANTNTPTLVSSVGTQGDYFKVSVAGVTPIDSNSNWEVGDIIAFSTKWDKFAGPSDQFPSLTVAAVGRVLPTPQTGALIQAGSNDGIVTRVELNSFGASTHFSGVRYDGTLAVPTALAANDLIVGFNGFGYNGAAVVGPAVSFRGYAAETWSSGHQGTYQRAAVTPIGSTTLTDALSIENDGGVCISPSVTGGSKGAGTLNAAGLYVNGTAVGTSAIAADTFLANATNASAAPAAITIPFAKPQCRLTLTAATPVLTATVTASANVLLTPYDGNQLPIPNANGGGFIMTTFAELTNILANSSTGSAGPAAAVASSVYDLFAWSNSGVITLTRGPAWTNITTRSAGTVLVRNNGLLVNSVAITNGPGAGLGLYVGSVATDGGGATVSYTFGAAASGGTAGSFGVWNNFNRRVTTTSVVDSGSGYTYSTATIRAARASNANRITWVSGLAEDGVSCSYLVRVNTVAAAAAFGSIGIGLDVTNAFSIGPAAGYTSTANVTAFYPAVPGVVAPQTGSHYLQAAEQGDGTNANTFNSNSLATLSATIWN